MLLTWLLFRSRAPVVVLGSKLLLPMRSSWPVFPGLDQDLFPRRFSSFFGIRFQNGAKECHMSVTFVVVSVVLLCFRPIFPFSSFQPFLFIGGFDSSALCRSWRELSNAYLLAKFGFDTAENGPCQVCPIEPSLAVDPKPCSLSCAAVASPGNCSGRCPSARSCRRSCGSGNPRSAPTLMDQLSIALLGSWGAVSERVCRSRRRPYEGLTLVERFDIEPFPDFSAK